MPETVPFTRPSMDDTDIKKIASLVVAVLKGGQIAAGPHVKEFEERVRRHVQTRFLLALSTGTAALHVSLAALRIRRGDEVLVPANTFVSTANAVVYQGAKPIFVDVDRDTFNLSPDDLQQKISSRSKAVIPVHLGGNPCNMKSISEIAAEKHLSIVEDATQALGATYRGRFCGNLAMMGVFSFDHAKIITTAEGGAIATEDEKLADRINIFRNVGRTSYGSGSIEEIGYNYRLSEIHAVLGIILERNFKRNLSNRKKAGLLYRRLLSRVPWIKFQTFEPDSNSSHHASLILIDKNAPLSRDELMAGLAKKQIGSSILFKPVHLWPAYRTLLGDLQGTCPIAEELGEHGMALPMFNTITPAQVQHVASSIDELAKGRGERFPYG